MEDSCGHNSGNLISDFRDRLEEVRTQIAGLGQYKEVVVIVDSETSCASGELLSVENALVYMNTRAVVMTVLYVPASGVSSLLNLKIISDGRIVNTCLLPAGAQTITLCAMCAEVGCCLAILRGHWSVFGVLPSMQRITENLSCVCPCQVRINCQSWSVPSRLVSYRTVSMRAVSRQDQDRYLGQYIRRSIS